MLRKQLITGLLMFAILAAFPFASAHADELQSSITGLETSYEAKSYKAKLVGTVKISPAYGRTVVLEMKDPESGEWVEKKTYVTEDTKTAKVKVIFPAEFKQHGSLTWRVRVPKTDHGEDVLQAAKARTKTKTAYGSARAFIIMDAKTGKVLYEKNARARRAIASMTKMMTAIQLVENRKLNHRIKITKAAAKTDYAMGLVAGDSATAWGLLHALMLPSSNDAATAIAIDIAGSSKAFVKRMNTRAKELGCTDTRYYNPHGLPHKKKPYSTALDQARIGSYIMTSKKTDAIRKVVRKKRAKLKTKKRRSYELVSTNALLGSKYKAIGLKTGFTNAAKCTFTGAFKVGKRTYVTVVLGNETRAGNWKDTKTLRKFISYARSHNLKSFEMK